jgi:hypothetical protein
VVCSCLFCFEPLTTFVDSFSSAMASNAFVNLILMNFNGRASDPARVCWARATFWKYTFELCSTERFPRCAMVEKACSAPLFAMVLRVAVLLGVHRVTSPAHRNHFNRGRACHASCL